ncbi:hypothetical protein CANARDRAFT_192733 [[Candida] arabinofermentans NRRL YB-2248]|uniref:F-actin-capping protein subunit alpha n=1 Tax=[Candida] arabinofermentans NRRL YB-2248 TaxID=983967 RepID=A0A1E4T985_9ASCO|nr:hypothetical protein CANARDRAFT_192733 [[Candida] arabinofermentans NRRL YB-2248]
MSDSLQTIISSMINDAPPGNGINLINDIKIILNNENSKRIISENVKQYHLNKDFKLVKLSDSSVGLLSKYNQTGLKFYDLSLGLKFDYDFDAFKVIDIEKIDDNDDDKLPADDEILKLSNIVEEYASQHFPTFYKSIVVPDSNDSDIIYIIIVDENLNDANYYNGKWQSFYKFTKSTGELTGEIGIKVHYYEEGNFILNTVKKVNESKISLSNIVDTIEKIENEFELSVFSKFSNLNEKVFKSLRRQLPINRSKVQWGKAIGNYKLGQDAAGGRH